MFEYLGSPLAKFFFVPLLTAILGLIIKVSSVNDKYPLELSEWFFLGPDMISAGFLLVFVELCNAIQRNLEDGTQEFTGIIVSLLLCVASLIVMPLVIRKLGCKDIPTAGFRHKIWWGIVLPDLWGVGLLYGILVLLSK